MPIPPEYIAEKLRNTIELIHGLRQSVVLAVPDDLPTPEGWTAPDGFSAKADLLMSPAQSAFHFSLLSFLAIYGFPEINGRDLETRLLNAPTEQLIRWLDTVEKVGVAGGDARKPPDLIL